MSKPSRPADEKKEREHEGDPAVEGGNRRAPGESSGEDGGKQPADGSRSRHDENQQGRSS